MPDIDIVIKATDRASGALKDVNRELGKMDGHSKGLPGPLGTLSSALGTGLKLAAQAALVAVAALGVGLGLALKGSVTAAADAEQGVADIRSIFGKTAPSAEELSKAISDIALDPTLKVNATQAAEAINILAKNGISWEDIQGGMLRSTVLLANATNDDFGTAADVATNAMVNFNKGAGDMEQVINGIIGVTQASQFDINDYSLALSQAGGVAGSVGVDFEDFNALLAGTSSSFASGSDAGTSYKTFLQQLVPDTNKSADAMRELGLFSGLTGTEFDKLSSKISDTEQDIAALDPTSKNYGEQLSKLTLKLAEQRGELLVGGSAFFDANGNMKSAAEIAAALSEAFSGLSDAERITAASTIFGTDAMRTALSLADQGGNVIADFKKVIGETSAEEAAATRMDTLKGSWEIFQGVLETLNIQIGQAFLPLVRDMVTWLTKLATENGPKVIEWVTGFRTSISTLVELLRSGSDPLTAFQEAFKNLIPPETMTAITNIVVGIRSAIDWVGKTIGPFVSWKDVLTGLGLVLGTIVVAAVPSFVAAIAPVAALLAGVILAVSLLRNAWEKDWGGIQEKTKVALDYISGRLGPLVAVIKTFGADALKEIGAFVTGNETKFTALGKIWDSAKTTFSKLFSDMGSAVTTAGAPILAWFDKNFPQASAALKKAFEDVSKRFGELWETIKTMFKTGSDGVGTALANMQKWWKEHGAEVMKTVDGFLAGVITIISSAITIMTTALKLFLQIITGDWKGAWESIKTIASSLLTVIKTLWNGFMTVMKAAWNDFAGDINAIWDTGLGKVLAITKDKWDAIKSAILLKIGEILTVAVTKWNEIKAAIADKIENVLTNAKDKWEQIKAAIRDRIEDVLANAKTKWDEIKTAISTKINDITSTVKTKWDEIKTAITSKVSEIATVLSTEFDKMRTAISDKIGDMVTRARTKFEEVKSAIATKLAEIVTAVTAKAGEIVTGFTTGLGNLVTSVAAKLTDVKNAVTTPFANAKDWLFSAGQNVVQGFIDGIGGMISSAQTKVSELATLAAQAATAALGIQSPSKVFMKIGHNVAAGFVKGIDLGMAKMAPTLNNVNTWAPTLPIGGATSINNSRTTSNQMIVQVQSSGNAVQDIRNQVELYALTYGAA